MTNDDPKQPAGWYPTDGDQRYWDGQAWTDHTAPAAAPAAPGGRPKWLIPLVACLALAFVAVILGAIAGGGDDQAAATTTTTTTTASTTVAPEPSPTPAAEAPTTAAPSTAPATIPADCTEATASDVEAIEFYLTGDATLGEAYTADGPDGRWVTANVYGPDGTREASLTEWVFLDGTDAVATSSSNAADVSDGLAEARDVGISPGNRPDGLTECVTAATRGR